MPPANEFALEKGKQTGATIVMNTDLTPYIKLNSATSIPPCPAGGTYTEAAVGTPPTCSLSSLTDNPHFLP